MLFGNQAQAARGREIQRPCIACDFSQHESEITATQPFFEREERIFRRARLDMHEAVSQPSREAGMVWPATKTHGRAVLHPENHPAILPLRQRSGLGSAQSVESHRQRQRRPAPFVARSENLVVERRGKTRAPPRIVGPRQTQGSRMCGRMRVHENRKGANGTSHLFLICSICRRFAILPCNLSPGSTGSPAVPERNPSPKH